MKQDIKTDQCASVKVLSFSVKIVWRSDSTRTPEGASLRLPGWIYWGRKGEKGEGKRIRIGRKKWGEKGEAGT